MDLRAQQCSNYDDDTHTYIPYEAGKYKHPSPPWLMWCSLASVLPKICKPRLRSPFSNFPWMFSRKHDLYLSDCSIDWIIAIAIPIISDSLLEGINVCRNCQFSGLLVASVFSACVHSKPTYRLVLAHFRRRSVQTDLQSHQQQWYQCHRSHQCNPRNVMCDGIWRERSVSGCHMHSKVSQLLFSLLQG